jgi:hypothetical protein
MIYFTVLPTGRPVMSPSVSTALPTAALQQTPHNGLLLLVSDAFR